MPTLTVAHLDSIVFGPDLADYLHHIDATLAPFEGRILGHGGRAAVPEGEWHCFLTVVRFPSRELAEQ